MRIKKIHIQNYKSLVDFELHHPPSFCAFVGPNASGKSNFFEALEFSNYVAKFTFETPMLFGGKNSIVSFNPIEIISYLGKRDLLFEVVFEDGLNIYFDTLFSSTNTERFESIGSSNSDINITQITDLKLRTTQLTQLNSTNNKYNKELEIFFDNFSRIFIGKSELKRINQSSEKLQVDASNLSQIIGQIFQDESKKKDFIEWLRILIPEFNEIEVKQSNIDGSFEFFVYENGSSKPFPRHLLSDGTKNILALMAAVYQNNQPQFLCIEEPENGLHPQAIELLVDFFREKCESEGHHIWLNTHSPSLVRCLSANEIITLNKKSGQTVAKQFTKEDAVNIKTDEAWLTNMLGGGVL